MNRSETAHPTGFTQAEALDAMLAEDSSRHDRDLRDLIRVGDFLAPETHRQGGVDAAASALREWADDDVEMLAEAEVVAREQHHDYSAEILHRARVLAAA
jgi:hypothetical protein